MRPHVALAFEDSEWYAGVLIVESKTNGEFFEFRSIIS